MKARELRIGVLTLPLAKASLAPLSNLVEILFNISTEFVLITGNEGYEIFKNGCRFKVYNVSYKIGNPFLKVIRNLYGQIIISMIIIKDQKNINQWVIFGGEREFIILIILKLLRKKIIILILGSATKDYSYANDFFRHIIKILVKIKLLLADKIVVYSPRLISEWQLEKYRHKILVAHRHFLDFEKFRVITPLPERPFLVGYIGRLSEEKGIQNFIRAFPEILNNQQNLHFIIVGDGPLMDNVEDYLEEENLKENVEILGWISHDDLSQYLNQLQLLVLPSYTEGLPNIMLEAMACGTPVLVTPVGAIPDIITDRETGYIMKDNLSENIAKSVIEALNSPNLEMIADNGRRFVEENFTFEIVVKNWERLLS